MLFKRSSISGPVAVLALLSISAASAYADISTGFEPPSYTIGPLAGQNGWQVFGPGVVTVEGFQVYSGTQAVFVDGGSSATGQSGPYIQTTTGPDTVLSAEIYLASSGDETGWQFASTGTGLLGYAAGIDIYATSNPTESTIEAITGSGGGVPVIGTFTRNQWNNVSIDMNYTTQTYSVVLNGTTLASNLAFCGNNSGGCNGAPVSSVNADEFFDTFGGGGTSNDAGFIDNFSAVSTPEPSFYIPVAFGLLALTAARWKRYKRHSANQA